MSAAVIKLIKKSLNAFGVDLVRYRPQYELGGYAYLTSLNIKTIIDAGAHTGEFARMIKKVLPEAAIISFEPLKDTFRQLETKMRGVPGFQAFNCALGDADATVEMHRSSFPQSSSILKMADLHKQAFPETAGETLESVEVKRLDDVLAGLTLQPEILVKIDVQGYEDKVIAGGENLIARARAIIIEVSFRKLYETQPLFDHVYHLLRERGFTYMGNLFQLNSPADGSALQADALFIREEPEHARPNEDSGGNI